MTARPVAQRATKPASMSRHPRSSSCTPKPPPSPPTGPQGYGKRLSVAAGSPSLRASDRTHTHRLAKALERATPHAPERHTGQIADVVADRGGGKDFAAVCRLGDARRGVHDVANNVVVASHVHLAVMHANAKV